MPRAAKRPKPPGDGVGAVIRLPSVRDVVRISRPANDNLPPWALRAGRIILAGCAVLAILVIAALVYAR